MRNATLLLAGFLALVPFDAAQAQSMEGMWLTRGGDLEGKFGIDFRPHGPNYCGALAWLKEPNQGGRPKTDNKNPAEGLRSRPLLGLNIMPLLTSESGERLAGDMYDPDSGKTYWVKLGSIRNGTVEAKICVHLFGVPCRTHALERLSADQIAKLSPPIKRNSSCQ